MLSKWDLPLFFTHFPVGAIKQVPSNFSELLFGEAKLFFCGTKSKNCLKSSCPLHTFFSLLFYFFYKALPVCSCSREAVSRFTSPLGAGFCWKAFRPARPARRLCRWFLAASHGAASWWGSDVLYIAHTDLESF